VADLFYVDGKGTRNPVEASIFNEERGLKVCIVDDICEKKYSGFHSRGRIVLRKDASSISIAHEIGHGCDLRDIYI
jgi:hypothetical protein